MKSDNSQTNGRQPIEPTVEEVKDWANWHKIHSLNLEENCPLIEKNLEQMAQQSKEIKLTGQLHPKCKAMFDRLQEKGLI